MWKQRFANELPLIGDRKDGVCLRLPGQKSSSPYAAISAMLEKLFHKASSPYPLCITKFTFRPILSKKKFGRFFRFFARKFWFTYEEIYWVLELISCFKNIKRSKRTIYLGYFILIDSSNWFTKARLTIFDWFSKNGFISALTGIFSTRDETRSIYHQFFLHLMSHS